MLRSVLFAVLFPYVALGRPIVFMCVVIQTPKSRKKGDTVAIDETNYLIWHIRVWLVGWWVGWR